MKRRCPWYPRKRRYSRPLAVRHAAILGSKGERHVKVFWCVGCSSWHIGRDHARIKLEERQG